MVKKRKPNKSAVQQKPKQVRSTPTPGLARSESKRASAPAHSEEGGKPETLADIQAAVVASESFAGRPLRPPPKGEARRKDKTPSKTTVVVTAPTATPSTSSDRIRDRTDAAPGRGMSFSKARTGRPESSDLQPPAAAQLKTQSETEKTESFAGLASQPFQDFAAETQRIARETFEETTSLLEKLRGAKNPMELLTLQTNYMQQSLRMYAALAQGFGKLMATSQSTLMKQSQATIESLRSITGKN